jgi:transposase
LHVQLFKLLRKAGELETHTVIVDAVLVRAFGGGEATGPSPVDRRKAGTKHTIMVDRNGVPLAIRTAGANASDHGQLLPIVLDFPRVGGKPGRPKELPDAAYADRGYDSDAARALLAWLGIKPHLAKRRTKHGSGLGKVRWVVERTISWFKGLRRLRVRYDRLRVIQEAWNTLAASVICFRIAQESLVDIL